MLELLMGWIRLLESAPPGPAISLGILCVTWPMLGLMNAYALHAFNRRHFPQNMHLSPGYIHVVCFVGVIVLGWLLSIAFVLCCIFCRDTRRAMARAIRHFASLWTLRPVRQLNPAE